MRIALLSTCAVAVPPSAYGGTELITSELARTLTALGHDVTVFATGDSTPRGTLRAHFAKAVWPPDDLAELRHAAYAWREIATAEVPFDVVHAHQAPSIAFSKVCTAPTVLTMHHDRVDALAEFYADFPHVSYVAISRRQADLVPEVPVSDVVHHGLDIDRYQAGDGAGGYLAFLGRFAPQKGPHLAIDVALASGLVLEMGGKPHWENREFFDDEVKPRLDRAGDRVVWNGEVGFEPKLAMLRGARALLFPIEWEEPFGLVMIESMLVGTPVIAFARGAAPEVVDDGVTGFLVQNVDEMRDRVRRLGEIDRDKCRARARERFDAFRMARDYERVYAEAMASPRSLARPRPKAVSGVRMTLRGVASAAAHESSKSGTAGKTK